MPHTIPAREVSDEEIADVAKAIAPFRKQVSDTPELLSLLYDIDLLPEQIGFITNAMRMIVICELFKKVPKEEIAKMMSGDQG